MAYKIDLLKYGARMLSFYCSINHFFVDAKNETKSCCIYSLITGAIAKS
jgi:hypothetical protein